MMQQPPSSFQPAYYQPQPSQAYYPEQQPPFLPQDQPHPGSQFPYDYQHPAVPIQFSQQLPQQAYPPNNAYPQNQASPVDQQSSLPVLYGSSQPSSSLSLSDARKAAAEMFK